MDSPILAMAAAASPLGGAGGWGEDDVASRCAVRCRSAYAPATRCPEHHGRVPPTVLRHHASVFNALTLSLSIAHFNHTSLELLLPLPHRSAMKVPPRPTPTLRKVPPLHRKSSASAPQKFRGSPLGDALP
eukprot:1709069-Rhodomonas_salina.1